jgi:hypothetical protein
MSPKKKDIVKEAAVKIRLNFKVVGRHSVEFLKINIRQ